MNIFKMNSHKSNHCFVLGLNKRLFERESVPETLAFLFLGVEFLNELTDLLDLSPFGVTSGSAAGGR